MEAIVIAILWTPTFSVAFLKKLTDVCAGRHVLQPVSRKEEGEMMLQDWAPTVSGHVCPKDIPYDKIH